MAMKREYHIGSIVGINGRNIDYGDCNICKNIPTLDGIVENGKEYNTDITINLKEEWSLVTFIVNIEYHWYDKNCVNVFRAAMTILAPLSSLLH